MKNMKTMACLIIAAVCFSLQSIAIAADWEYGKLIVKRWTEDSTTYTWESKDKSFKANSRYEFLVKYSSQYKPSSPTTLLYLLNHLGEDGWDLFIFTNDPEEKYKGISDMYLFKRQSKPAN